MIEVANGSFFNVLEVNLSRIWILSVKLVLYYYLGIHLAKNE